MMSFCFSPRPHRADTIPWRTWSPEAFAEAQARKKPVLLCISALWCGWSHRMDEEAYSDGLVQQLISRDFIPIRVDADWRPEIDRRYNRGGWPTTAFLSPEGELLAGATYVPTAELRDFLVQFSEEYLRDQERILARLRELAQRREEAAKEQVRPGVLTPQIPARCAELVFAAFDRTNGGFGTAPKFIHGEALQFALEWAQQTLDLNLAALVKYTLESMLLSPLYDREDGAFFRYANDAEWEQPEHERTLEENMLLAALYARASHVFREPAFLEVARSVLAYAQRVLQDPATGAFYGSVFASPEHYGLPSAQRQAQPPLLVDKAIHAKPNAVAASACVEAYQASLEPRYLAVARQVLDFLWDHLWDPTRGLAHNWLHGPHVWGWLPDQTFAALAMLDTYEVSGERIYLERARSLAEHILRAHHDPATGGFWDLANDVRQQETGLLRQPQELMLDVAFTGLLFVRLWRLLDEERYREVATHALANYAGIFAAFGHFAAPYGQAVDRLLREPVVITVVGPANAPETQTLFQAALQVHTPGQITRLWDSERDADLLQKCGLAARKSPTAHIWRGAERYLPATTPGALRSLFEQVTTTVNAARGG
jgi:uncharacterized protein YyaL (SSP411 family)